MRDHLAAHTHFPFVERRRIDRNQKLRAQLDQFLSWIVRVKPLTPERFVIPKIFANCYPCLSTGEIEQAALSRGFKISRIIEDVVFRQKGFVSKPDQVAIGNHGGSIVEFAPRRLITGPYGANNRRQTRGGL